MPIHVSERWSDYKLSFKTPWTAQRGFDVTGTSSGAAALAAVDATVPTILVPQRNAGHPYAPLKLKCEGPSIADSKGPEHFHIIAPYSVPSGGTFDDPPPDPLSDQVRIIWRDVEVSEPVDLDLDGRALCYSNGEVIEGLSRPIKYKELTVIRNFPTWDTSWNSNYENAVNATSVILTGGPTVAAQHLRLCSIIPAEEYVVGGLFIPIAATMEIIFDASLGDFPFQHRVMDQGERGFNSSNQSTPFVDADGEPVTRKYRLDGTGKPMSVDGGSTIKVKKAGALEAPTANTTPWTDSTGTTWTGGTVGRKVATATGEIGYFKKIKIVDVNPFLALYNT